MGISFLRYGTHMFDMIMLIWCLECPLLHQFLRLHNLDWWHRYTHHSNAHTTHGCQFHWWILHTLGNSYLASLKQNKWQRWECINGALIYCRRLGRWCICGRWKKIGWMSIMLYLNLWDEWIGVWSRNWRCKCEKVLSGFVWDWECMTFRCSQSSNRSTEGALKGTGPCWMPV